MAESFVLPSAGNARASNDDDRQTATPVRRMRAILLQSFTDGQWPDSALLSHDETDYSTDARRRAVTTPTECLFCSIARGSTAAVRLYEDAHVMAFLDVA